MTIHVISPRGVALYITPADLREYGLTPATLTPERTLALARAALSEAGAEIDGPIEIDAFPDTCGVLVFVRIKPPGEDRFSFYDSESLLRAVRIVPAPCPSGCRAKRGRAFPCGGAGRRRKCYFVQ